MSRSGLRWGCLLLGTVWLMQAWAFEPKTQPFRQPGHPAGNVQSARPVSGTSTQDGGGEAAGGLEGHFLRAVMLNGRNSMANVDGQLLRLGDTLDGWRLQRLTADRAVFVHKTGHQVLELQRPQVAGEAAKAPPADGLIRGTMVNPPVPGGESVSPAGQAAGPVVSSPLGGANAASPVPAIPPELLNKLIGSKN